MNKLKLLAVGLLVVLTGGVSVAWLQREPTYQGRTLREWLESVDETNNARGLEKIAARAVPYYAKMLQRKDTALHRFCRGCWLRLPDSLQGLVAEPLPADTARIGAAVLLKYSGPLANGAVPILLGCVKDPNEAVRESALEAVAEIQPGSPAMLPVFIEAGRDAFDGVRRCAMEALVHFGPAGQAALPIVTERLKDNSSRVRVCAAGALWAIAHRTNEVMGVLTETIHNEDSTTRALSANYLGLVGPPARPLVPALLAALKDNKDVAEQAAEALRKIDPEAAARAGVRE
jgi:HEAT repeat protein